MLNSSEATTEAKIQINYEGRHIIDLKGNLNESGETMHIEEQWLREGSPSEEQWWEITKQHFFDRMATALVISRTARLN